MSIEPAWCLSSLRRSQWMLQVWAALREVTFWGPERGWDQSLYRQVTYVLLLWQPGSCQKRTGICWSTLDIQDQVTKWNPIIGFGITPDLNYQGINVLGIILEFWGRKVLCKKKKKKTKIIQKPLVEIKIFFEIHNKNIHCYFSAFFEKNVAKYTC